MFQPHLRLDFLIDRFNLLFNHLILIVTQTRHNILCWASFHRTLQISIFTTSSSVASERYCSAFPGGSAARPFIDCTVDCTSGQQSSFWELFLPYLGDARIASGLKSSKDVDAESILKVSDTEPCSLRPQPFEAKSCFLGRAVFGVTISRKVE
jgi:hypothetical protein